MDGPTCVASAATPEGGRSTSRLSASRLGSALVMVVAVMTLLPLSAAAVGNASVPTRWSTVTAQSPTTWPGGYFVTMSCLSSTACFSSGNTTASRVDSAFVERWNGSGWRLSSLGRHKAMEAGGISCTSTKNCVMVGGTAFNGSSTVRIEHFNGTSWHEISQTSGGGFLSDVVCRSKSWCLAVGWHVTANQARTNVVSELWNGSTWRSLRVPSSSMARTTLLEISCISERNCLATGQAFPAANYPRALFSEHWNGSKWSIVKIPTPKDGSKKVVAIPNDLSCPTSSRCVAVGYWYPVLSGRAPQFPMAEVWNGSAWKQLTLSSSIRSHFQLFSDVSCVAATECWIVGEGYASDSGPTAAAAYWNGSSFTLGSVVRPGVNSELDAVHCVARANCLALGSLVKTYGAKPKVLGERDAAP